MVMTGGGGGGGGGGVWALATVDVGKDFDSNETGACAATVGAGEEDRRGGGGGGGDCDGGGAAALDTEAYCLSVVEAEGTGTEAKDGGLGKNCWLVTDAFMRRQCSRNWYTRRRVMTSPIR